MLPKSSFKDRVPRKPTGLPLIEIGVLVMLNVDMSEKDRVRLIRRLTFDCHHIYQTRVQVACTIFRELHRMMTPTMGLNLSIHLFF